MLATPCLDRTVACGRAAECRLAARTARQRARTPRSLHSHAPCPNGTGPALSRRHLFVGMADHRSRLAVRVQPSARCEESRMGPPGPSAARSKPLRAPAYRPPGRSAPLHVRLAEGATTSSADGRDGSAGRRCEALGGCRVPARAGGRAAEADAMAPGRCAAHALVAAPGCVGLHRRIPRADGGGRSLSPRRDGCAPIARRRGSGRTIGATAARALDR